MTWRPIAGAPFQISASDNTLASGYYLKFYQSGTTTATNMATDSTGGTTLAKCQINAAGYPINGSSAVFIPYIDQKYKLALYTNSTDADADTLGNADWVVDAVDWTADIRDELANTSNSAQGDALIGVLRTATSAVATTNHAMLELDAYYVCRDFGAPVDGTDGTAEIQAAIDAVDDTIGGTVVIDGLVGISATGLVIDGKTNFRMVTLGEGTGLKCLAASTGASTTAFGTTSIAFKNCTRSILSGLIINGNSVASSAIGCELNDKCVITRCHIYSTGDNAVTSEGGTDNEYSYNTITTTTNAGRGFWIGNTGAVAYMETDAKIIGNTIDATAGTGIVGALIGGVIEGNICHDGTAGSGIIVGALGPAAALGYGRYVTINGNYVYNWTGTGIQSDVSAGTAGTDYTYNVICSNNVCYNNTNAGIFLTNSNGWVVDGNICANNGSAGSVGGINGNMVQNCIISNNYCFDDQGTPTQDFGIYLLNTLSTSVNTSNIVVQGNFCRGNTTGGIYVTQTATYYVDTILIDGNICIDGAADGITVAHSSAGQITNVTVTNNNCTNNSSVDLRVDPPDAIIENNLYATSTNLGAYAFTDQDATPSVKSRKFWKTANTIATTITDFDDGRAGQEIVVHIADTNTTIDFTASGLKGNVGVDWSPTTGDHMRCIYDGTDWLCDVSDNTA